MAKKLLTTAFILFLYALPAISQQYSPERDFSAIPINNNTAVRIMGYSGTSTEVNIPSTFLGLPVVEIGVDAFRNRRLTSVTIPNSVTTIRNGAFRYNQLTSITIPNSVTYLGSGAFWGNRLTDVVIPNSITIIGRSLFSQNQLTSIVIPSSVTEIGAYAFSENQFVSVVIPSNVRGIAGRAFAQNPLSSITIGADVYVISGAFPGNFEQVYRSFNNVAGTYVVIRGTSQWWLETEEVRQARQEQERLEREQQAEQERLERERQEQEREQARVREEERVRVRQERIEQIEQLHRELNTSLEGVVINGVRWATRNVNAPRTFADNPEDVGMLYVANIGSRSSLNWAVVRTDNRGVANPCPRGWRIPTRDELEKLVRIGSIRTTRNGVEGRMFGTAPNHIFLPELSYASRPPAQQISSSQATLWILVNGGISTTTIGSNIRQREFGIRCVADE